MVGAALPLDKDTVGIGRSSDNEICLEEEKISRFHARILLKDSRYYIEDLNSGCGTQVNGALIREPHEIQDHDQIQIANFLLEFRQE